MNRKEFLLSLEKKLKRLPPEERKNAVRYYEEYLDDAGPQSETSAIASLGTPDQVAAKILTECAIKVTDGSQKSGPSSAKLVFFAICAAPIAVPLAATAVLGMASLLLLMICVIAVVGLASAALAIGGICYVIAGFCVTAVSLPAMAFYIGIGIFCLGAAVPVALFTAWLSKTGFHWVAKLFSKLLRRETA